MGEGISETTAQRRESSPSALSQLVWILSFGGVFGVLMSVAYYRALGAPRAWKELTSAGVSGTWRIRSRRNCPGTKTTHQDWDPGVSRRLTQSVSYEGSEVTRDDMVGVNMPIMSRSDDWPLPRRGDTRPYFDFLMVVFSGDDRDALVKRDSMRSMYNTYGGEILITDERGQAYMYTLKVLYVVGHVGAAEQGDLFDDVLYVKAQRGYRNIAAKTKKMLEAVNHVRFKYLLKADDDTFVCLRRTASQIHLVPPHIKPKLYGGIPTACHLPNNPDEFVGKVIKDETNKWYDGKYLNHTMDGLDCYPVYMQGAFYILSYPLVEFLNQGSSKLLTFDNEDVTIGLWLHGVDRAIFPLNDLRDARLWECSCKRGNFVPVKDANVFFHNCKSIQDMQSCKESLPEC